MSVEPDGFIGSVMALESITGSMVLIHGPGGCRKNVLSLASKCFPKPLPFIDTHNEYFSGYPRLPCTCIEELDYIMGSSNRIKDALDVLNPDDFDLVAVVYSPGASLIGDNCVENLSDHMNNKIFVLDRTMHLESAGEGYDHTLVSIVKWIKPEPKEIIKNSVNLLGITILSKDWDTVVADITEILSFMEISVISVPGASATMDDLKSSVCASYNILLCPEYGINLAEYYSSAYGIPYYIPKSGAPVGFDAIESFILELSSIFSVSPHPALDHLLKVKNRAYRCMLSASGTAGTKGRDFAVKGDVSIVLPLVKWLYSYLSMIPKSIKVNEYGYAPFVKELTSFLESIGCADSLNTRIPEYVDLIACDGNTARLMECGGRCSKGLDISFPSIMNTDFVPKPVIGTYGALYILDVVVNP